MEIVFKVQKIKPVQSRKTFGEIATFRSDMDPMKSGESADKGM